MRGTKPKLGIEIEIQLTDSRAQGLAAAAVLNALLPYTASLTGLAMNLGGQIMIHEGGSQKALKVDIENLIETLKSSAMGTSSRLLPLLP